MEIMFILWYFLVICGFKIHASFIVQYILFSTDFLTFAICTVEVRNTDKYLKIKYKAPYRH